MNFIPEPFDLSASFFDWLYVVGILLGAFLVIGFVFSIVMGGSTGPQLFWRSLTTGAIDLTNFSRRRIWAIAVLTFRQAVRRKSLLIFVIFALLFMFAGWFLSESNEDEDLQVKVYISFVLTAITWLILPVVLILSCWGIPEDIKARSLHTVVTKPVRRSEVVLGRIMGFGMIGTLILMVMSSVGYIWIVRQVPEKSQKLLRSRVPVFGKLSFRNSEGNPGVGQNVGDTSSIRRSGFINGLTRACGVYTFDNISQDIGKITLESRFEAYRSHKGKIDQPLQCEIRIVKELRERTALGLGASYSKFSVLTSAIRNEKYATAGKSMITLAERFESGEDLPRFMDHWSMIADGYEDFARVMRPFSKIKDNAEWTQGVAEAAQNASNAARGATRKSTPNERKAIASKVAQEMKTIANSFLEHADEYKDFLLDRVHTRPAFSITEFSFDEITIERKLSYQENGVTHEGDLYDDLVHGGELQIQVYCLDRGQLLGMARPDLLILRDDLPFYSGFFKAIFAIWLMVILTITLGVTASCFLKGPVATFAILTLLVLGSPFQSFLGQLTRGELEGGGFIEAADKMLSQASVRKKYEHETLIKVDNILLKGLWGINKIIPKYNSFSMSERVANGFDVPWAEKEKAILPSILMTLGFFFPCIILAYFSLKLRELESK